MKTKIINKILVAVMAAVMAVAAFGLTACGGDDDANKEREFVQVAGSAGLEYELNDNGDAYSLVGFGTCTATDVVIGNWYNGKPVTAISGAVFNTEDNEISVTVKSITVSYGIKTMDGMRCLQNMDVQKIILDDIPELGIAAVRKNANLKTMVIGKGLKEIKKDAFTLLAENSVKLHIYYKGSEDEWKKITIGENNDYLTSADCTVTYNYTGNGSEL